MKTTLELADDMAAELDNVARATGLPPEKVLANALREGLAKLAQDVPVEPQPFRQTTHQMGVYPRSDYTKALALADDLEVAENQSMNIQFTAVFREFPDGFSAFVEELPGANTQGATLEEARANLSEAITMVLAANRQLAEEELLGINVIREPLKIAVA